MDLAKIDTSPPGEWRTQTASSAVRPVETRPRLIEAASEPIFPPVQAVSAPELATAIDTANAFVRSQSAALEFSLDQESGRTIVKMIDTETDEVLRQFPSEEMLAISRSIDTLRGLIVNEKA
jgi:flagellar protein FlaG